MIKLKIKSGDKVIVIAGKCKGMAGEVLKVFPKLNKVIVQGINVVRKHVRPSKSDMAGGIKDKEMPIHISNVSLLDPVTNKPTRVGFKILEDGKKLRFCKSSGEIIDNVKV
ncbi:50S ribosomal protein L24 [Rickettsiales endosymbiont of Peranema trichophorum]|uniref:50S ribosomal protein L24 n=1 Tax=Rickettsiales endosymbiont of Peranema trichophorum TaxID=2486577 RepID=UPI001A92216D|nr:50S ribosomal protein L24 [Rickettsiales endosymbiont of Peranema trichophorum]